MNGLFRPEWSTLKKLMFLQSASGGGYATIVGNPVTFTAKAAPLRKLEVAFSPVQSLNGYDAPWPAGGGKNLVDPNATIYKRYLRDAGNGSYYWTYSADSASIVIKVESETAYTLSRYLTSGGIYRCSTIRVASLPSENDTSDIQTYQNVRETTATAFGTTRTVTTDSSATYVVIQFNGATVRDFVVNGQFEKGSSATDYAPYSNECPISGWSSLTVEQTGKNLYYYDATKATTGETTAGTIRGYYPLGLRNCTLTFSASLIEGKTPTRGNINIGKLSNGKLSVLNDFLTPSAIRQRTFTFAADEEAVLMSVSTNTGDLTDNLSRYNIMVEIGETAHDYEAFNGTSISISLGETVYSGYVDVVTGVGEVTSVAKMASALEWVNNGTYANTFNGTGFTERKQRIEGSIVNGCFCDSYAWYDSSQVGTRVNGIALAYNSSGSIDNRTRIYIKDSRFANAAEFVASLQNDDVMIALPLATPFTIQLTPQEVQSLAGDNTMWTDGDSVTVEYRSN